MSLIVQNGDPLQRRASFSRFVLPFDWDRIEPCRDATGPVYREAGPEDWLHAAKRGLPDTPTFLDAGRRRYCTEETKDILYRRAKWFVLAGGSSEPSVWKKFDVRRGTEDGVGLYHVVLRPPALVLFEFPDAPPLRDKESGRFHADLLRTGFAVIEAFFPDQNKAPLFEDLLRFNECFRYLRRPFEKHEKEFFKTELEDFRKGIIGDQGKSDGYWAKWEAALSFPIAYGGKTFQLQLTAPDGDEDAPLIVQPDDRAFTAATVFLGGRFNGLLSNDAPESMSSPAEVIARGFTPGAAPIPPFAAHWVKFLNVDSAYFKVRPTDCSVFEHDWAMPKTYRRWAHRGTLSGFTPHSFALMSGPAASGNGDHGDHGEPELALHAGQHYFDLTLLLLYVRCSLFRFSLALHDVSADARGPAIDRHAKVAWRRDFEKLRWQFMLFENLYQWPLLSNQQQHLEMYEIQRRAMDTQELYDEIRKEIESSDEVLESAVAEERNARAERLNIVAYWGLLLSLGLAGLSMVLGSIQALGPENSFGKCPAVLWSVHGGLVVVTLLCVAFLAFKGRDPSKRRTKEIGPCRKK